MSQQSVQQFSYASLDSMGDRLPQLKLDEGKQALVAFIESIPGMQSPPFVFCKVHWNSEMGEKGRYFQCFGGSCCEQVTWQKGWGGEPGKFDVNKARTRYFVPLIHYEPSPTNPTQMCATVKYLDMTFTAYDQLIKTLKANTEGLSFFERDIKLEATKTNGATTYLYHKGESKAQWLVQPQFKAEVEEQLLTVPTKLFNSMPQVLTESEFIAMKPQLDAKVKASMTAHGESAVQAQPASQYGALPAAQMFQAQPQPFTQPAVNIPVQPAQVETTQSAPTVAIPTVEAPVAEQAAPVEEKPFEIPQTSLSFDPTQILK